MSDLGADPLLHRIARTIRSNLLLILFICLITLQFLTWRAMLGLRAEIDSVGMAVNLSACGVPGRRACEVVVIPP